MFKISLTELEEVRVDPLAYKKKRDTVKRYFNNKSFFQTLKRAIYEYHNNTNAVAAMDYLENGLEKFKTRAFCEKAVDDLQWYIAEYQKLDWPTVLKKHNISIPLSTQFADSLKVTGEINRIDMHPNGTYAAWLFSKGKPKDWLNELRMPIIQNAVGVELGVLPEMVHVGIYCFENHVVNIHNFTNGDIRSAHLELEDLFKKMGF
jgi:hypothetical protein